jgi:hypothetical protein
MLQSSHIIAWRVILTICINDTIFFYTRSVENKPQRNPRYMKRTIDMNQMYQTTSDVNPWMVLPESLLAAARSVQRSTQAPMEIVIITMIASITTAFQARYDVESLNGSSLPMSLAFCLITESGSGKTAVMKECLREINKLDADMAIASEHSEKAYSCESSLYKRAVREIEKQIVKAISNEQDDSHLRERLARLHENAPIRARTVQIKREDTTVAGIRKWLSDNVPSGIVANSDAGPMLDHIIRNAAVYCDLWSGSDATIQRAYTSYRIRKPRVTFLLMIQPHHLNLHLNSRDPELRNGGLSGRFFFYEISPIFGRRSFTHNNSSFDDGHLERYHDIIAKGLRISFQGVDAYPTPIRLIPLDDGAKYQLNVLSQQTEIALLPGGMFHYASDLGSRIVEHVIRIAAPLAIFENPQHPVVTQQHVIMASTLVLNYAQAHVNRILGFALSGVEIKDADALFNVICRLMQSDKAFTYMHTRVIRRSELMPRAPRSLRDKDRFDPIIRILIDTKRIFEVTILGWRNTRVTTYSLEHIPPDELERITYGRRPHHTSPAGF